MRIARLLLATAVACGCGDVEVPAAELGERLFRDPAVSTSPFNAFSCATCHVADPGQPAVVPGRLDSGYNLGNSVGRPSWWGGYEVRLLDAINVCIDRFMGGRKLAPEDPAARQLYAFLDARSPEAASPAAPLTLVRHVTALDGMKGDPGRGGTVYTQSCYRCHGAVNTGVGRISPLATRVPEDTKKSFDPALVRAVVVEKVRHGRFYNIGGVMPFYSVEAMSDAEVADMLAYLGL